MTKKQHGARERDPVLERDRTDPGEVAAGDAQLDTEPPNVTEAEPPPSEDAQGGGGGGARPANASAAGAARPHNPGGPASAAAPGGGPGDGPATATADTPDAEDNAVAELRQIESDLDTLRRDFSTLSERHIRLAAEFDNYRKRVERERAEVWSRAQAELAGRLLDALDDLNRVTEHAETSSAEALAQGVILVERKLRQTLQAAGLEPIDAAGARFDPNSMEAVAMVPTESREEDDTVSDVFQPGYRFKGTLLRPARVRVRKHGA